jgi:hypothetical protein
MSEIVKEEEQQLTTTRQLVEAANNMVATAAGYISEALRSCSEAETAYIHEWALKGQDSFKAFSETSRDRLLKYIKSHGQVVTEKGTLEVDLGGGRVQRAVPISTKPDDKLTEKMLRDNKLPIESVMYATQIWKVDTAKFEAASKTWPKEMVDKCYKERSYRVGKTGVKGESDE